MRQLLFKNLTSQNTRRRILSICETVSHNGTKLMIQRRNTYTLKSRIHIKSASDVKKLEATYGNQAPFSDRRLHLIRKYNQKTGENKLFCRAHGLLYIVMNDDVLLIAFTNSLKISMKRL